MNGPYGEVAHFSQHDKCCFEDVAFCFKANLPTYWGQITASPFSKHVRIQFFCKKTLVQKKIR